MPISHQRMGILYIEFGHSWGRECPFSYGGLTYSSIRDRERVKEVTRLVMLSVG